MQHASRLSEGVAGHVGCGEEQDADKGEQDAQEPYPRNRQQKRRV